MSKVTVAGNHCPLVDSKLAPYILDKYTWLQRASHSQIAEFKSLAKSMQGDYAAIHAACSQSWSQGQVEGQVNRLKCIKRQMYGRANFDLLRLRVLHVA